MNFLELTQRLCREVGTGAVTTTINQSGEARRMVDWLNSAWMEIQGKHQDWDWLRTSASWATVASQATYALGSGAGTIGVTAATFGKWDKETFRCYLTASGTSDEAYLPFMDYEDWRNLYQYGSNRTSINRPTVFTIAPNKSIGLGSVPPVGYTVTADYFTCPLEMTADADIPALPAHFHLAIVYRAMMMYGAFEVASEVYQRGENDYRKMLHRIENDRLPRAKMGGPLA